MSVLDSYRSSDFMQYEEVSYLRVFSSKGDHLTTNLLQGIGLLVDYADFYIATDEV